MTALATKHVRRLTLAACLLAACLSLSACGLTGRASHPIAVSAGELEAGGEPYFFGGKVTYQIEITRQLNQFSSEDVQYLAGVKGAQDIAANQLWFGVFLWAKNQSPGTAISAAYNDFTIKDSEGNVYKPTPLNPSINQYAWTQQRLQHNDIEPGPDSTAAFGPTQGGLILFKLNTTIYSNRPLTLDIHIPGQKRDSSASLDL